ncbi:glycosyltransferase [Cyanobacterium sp. IPPAS B-1200]|uniref:glycosyltransferase n=1 Tax=Cyanobacterium sp. IPPAS B-1200 TaxID=1562720 RepID=UPI0008527A28|nr:glycosyltransferase [Cyanobacterium sp. IPPAS B-1200]OEJ79326.1 glycosyl transferase family 2 [Cyanobacterium sp. IPPAS B-1200]
MKPKISIILPSFNNRQYLDKRLKTIINQTFTDWELVVIDNLSDDGAWELIQEFAQKEPRMRISQAARKGMYVNWNNCIRLAQGEYIYIATNDDLMTLDCLEKMVTELEKYPECDICHCCLTIIDHQDREIPQKWYQFLPQLFYGELIHQKHIRFAPYDGILYCALTTVYCGPLQLLIRRSVFEKIGLFATNFGPAADFEWGMRAALVCNILHVPEELVSWRIHPQQATQSYSHNSSVHYENFIAMVKSALLILEKYNPEFYQKLDLEKLLFVYKRKALTAGFKGKSNKLDKIKYILSFFSPNPVFLAEFFYRRVFFARGKTDDCTYIRNELKRLQLEDSIKIIN